MRGYALRVREATCIKSDTDMLNKSSVELRLSQSLLHVHIENYTTIWFMNYLYIIIKNNIKKCLSCVQNTQKPALKQNCTCTQSIIQVSLY